LQIGVEKLATCNNQRGWETPPLAFPWFTEAGVIRKGRWQLWVQTNMGRPAVNAHRFHSGLQRSRSVGRGQERPPLSGEGAPVPPAARAAQRQPCGPGGRASAMGKRGSPSVPAPLLFPAWLKNLGF